MCKKRLLPSSILFTVLTCFLNLNGQDYILTLNHSTETIYSNGVEVKENIVTVNDVQNGNALQFSVDDVFSINYFTNKPDEIIIQSLSLDTIVCTLDSISSRKVFYRQENNLLQSVKKSEVFAVVFNEDKVVPKVEDFRKVYMQLQKTLIPQNHKFIRKNGEEINVKSINSIDSIAVNFNMVLNEVEMTTFVKTEDVKSVIFKEPIDKRFLRSNQSFLFSKEEKLREVSAISEITPDELKVKMYIGDNIVELPQKKEQINGLFFYDYNVLKEQQLINNSNAKFSINELEHKDAKFDASIGAGYLLAKTPDGIGSDMKEYLNDMRTGFVFDANLTIFPVEKFGFGLKYNQYHTRNSIPSVMEDNIRVSFFGLSFLSNSTFANNKGYFYSSVSLGYVSEVNNGKLLNESVTIKGSTLGMYLAVGVDFLLAENVALGLKSGLIGGTINEFKINGQKVKLDEPDNILRIDGTVGLTFYF